MARSISLVSIGVTEIGRKSAGCRGDGILGIGRIQASFHRQGTVDVDSDRLKRYVKWLQNMGEGMVIVENCFLLAY